MDGSRGYARANAGGHAGVGVELDKPTPRKALSSGVLHRTLDPSIARQVREIDPRLSVEWVANGIWWTPISRPPPGARLGAWRIGLRGFSGEVRGIKMWHPECADGRLIRWLTETWKQKLFIMRSESSTKETKAQRLAKVYKMQEEAEQKQFDHLWAKIDHGEMQRAARAEHECEKWRSNHQVHINTPDKGA